MSDLRSSLYLVRNSYRFYSGVEKASFNYSLYFSYELDDDVQHLLEEGEILDLEAETQNMDVFFKVKK